MHRKAVTALCFPTTVHTTWRHAYVQNLTALVVPSTPKSCFSMCSARYRKPQTTIKNSHPSLTGTTATNRYSKAYSLDGTKTRHPVIMPIFVTSYLNVVWQRISQINYALSKKVVPFIWPESTAEQLHCVASRSMTLKAHSYWLFFLVHSWIAVIITLTKG